MIQNNKLLENFNLLPPDKQAEVLDFIEFLNSKQKRDKSESAKQWKDIAGLATNPIMNQDAQKWVSQHRQDADRNRSFG